MVADGNSGLVAHGSGHVYGSGAVFLFKDGDGIQFHGNGVQRDRGQFRAISYEDGAFGIQIIIFDGAVAADEYVAGQPHGFLNAGSGLVAALVVLDGNAGREHQGSRGDFRPVRGGNVAAVSQENVAAGIEVAVSCRTQIGISHRNGAGTEIDAPRGSHGFRLADQDLGIFVFINGCRVDGPSGDESGIGQGNISMGDNFTADAVVHGQVHFINPDILSQFHGNFSRSIGDNRGDEGSRFGVDSCLYGGGMSGGDIVAVKKDAVSRYQLVVFQQQPCAVQGGAAFYGKDDSTFIRSAEHAVRHVADPDGSRPCYIHILHGD